MDIGAKEIDRMHRQRGWFQIGYHWVVRRNGTVEPGRPEEKAGAHIGDCGPGWNARSIGVCLVGGVASDGKTPQANFTPAQMAALGPLLADIKARFKIPAGRTMGHRDVIAMNPGAPPKACPCFDVKRWLSTGAVIELR